MGAARSVLLVGCGALGAAWFRSLCHRDVTAAPAAASQQRLDRLRHDVRGALSPALLCADRLLASDDPAVQHAGEVIVRAIERATALMEATRAPATAAPKDTV